MNEIHHLRVRCGKGRSRPCGPAAIFRSAHPPGCAAPRLVGTYNGKNTYLRIFSKLKLFMITTKVTELLPGEHMISFIGRIADGGDRGDQGRAGLLQLAAGLLQFAQHLLVPHHKAVDGMADIAWLHARHSQGGKGGLL